MFVLLSGVLQSIAGTTPPGVSGAVIVWGPNDNGQLDVPAEAKSGVTSVAIGAAHVMALKSDGSVIAWGGLPSGPFAQGSYGQAIVPPEAQSGVVAISAGYYHSVALKADGSVIAWGDNSHGECDVPLDAKSGVTAVSAGNGFTAALKSDGSVVAWGGNAGETFPAPAKSGVVAIAAAWFQLAVLKSDGSVHLLGGSPNVDKVPPGAEKGITSISASAGATIALKQDGSVLVWGGSFVNLTTIPAEAQNDVVSVEIADNHAVVLKRDGSVVEWGEAYFAMPIFKPYEANFGVAAIAAGGINSAIIIPPSTPRIVMQSSNLRVYEGEDARMAVVAAGYPYNVQWRKDGVEIGGATNLVYSLTNIRSHQAGSYSVVVSTASGSVTNDLPIGLKVDPMLRRFVYGAPFDDSGDFDPESAQLGVIAIAQGGGIAWDSNRMVQSLPRQCKCLLAANCTTTDNLKFLRVRRVVSSELLLANYQVTQLKMTER